MELSLLPLMLLLILNVHPAHTQGQVASLAHSKAAKPRLTVDDKPSQIFRGDTVELKCKIKGEDWTYTFQCGDKPHNSKDEDEFKITVELTQSCKCKACRGSVCSEWSNAVKLTVSDPNVTVKPQSSVFTGDTVILICDVRRSTARTIYWFKDFKRIKADSETVTLRDVKVSDGGRYACDVQNKTTQSQGVVLTVRESSGLESSKAGLIAGLSVTFLLIFALVLLWCCKHKGAGSPCSSTDHQPQNIKQTSEQKMSGQTPPQSDTIYGPSYVSYAKIDLKSMNEIKEKKKDQGKKSCDTVYSKLKIKGSVAGSI